MIRSPLDAIFQFFIILLKIISDYKLIIDKHRKDEKVASENKFGYIVLVKILSGIR
jgi:hypothetical protein